MSYVEKDTIMHVLTPKPAGDPKAKNKAVDFGVPKFVNAIKATSKIITGINRTKNTL